MRTFGAGVLLATGWQAAVLLSALPRHVGAPTFWLTLGAHLVVWLPAVAGGILLLRGRPSGYHPVYAPATLLLVSGLVPFFPLPHWLLGPLRYGVPPHRGTSGLAALALPVAVLTLLVLAHRFGVRSAPSPPQRPGGARRLRPGPLLVLGILVYVVCCYGRAWIGQAAAAAVNRGITAYEAGRRQEALAEWERVRDRYPGTPAWGVAVFNLGVGLREQHRYREAIAQFETLLGSSLDDRDPSGYLMEAYQNYHHRACVEVSACHEGLGDYPSALRFAVLARDAYPYQTWCGTCEEEAHKELADRIARLERDGDKAR
jgi:hypothetical protein